MEKPKIAGKAPIGAELEEGKKYAWCSCGLSANQPFCDGSHKGTSFVPTIIEAEETKTAYLCTCKQAANGVYCDGSHNKL